MDKSNDVGYGKGVCLEILAPSQGIEELHDSLSFLSSAQMKEANFKAVNFLGVMDVFCHVL